MDAQIINSPSSVDHVSGKITTAEGNQAMHDDLENDIVFNIRGTPLVVLAKSGVVSFWNTGAHQSLGYRADEIIGSHVIRIFSNDQPAAEVITNLLIQAAHEGHAAFEGWLMRNDDQRVRVLLTVNLLVSQQQTEERFLVTWNEITSLKQVEDNQSNVIERLMRENVLLKQQEERYHRMLNEVQDYAIILLDADGIIREWNKGAERIKGYAPKEIIGQSFRLFYSREDKDAQLPDYLLNTARLRGTAHHEGWRIRKDGSRFWGSIVITALHEDGGDVVGFTKLTRDLTQRKLSEDKLTRATHELQLVNDQLRASEERYHRMISEVQDYAIILLSPVGIIENWNTGAEFIKGYHAKEIVGKHFSLFYTRKDLEENLPQRLLGEARQQGKAVHEGWRVRKDGTTFWGSVVLTALHDKEGQITGYSKVTRDLTGKKLTEDALREAASQLQEKNKELETVNTQLSSFAYVASHDLKEPVRKIQVFLSRLQDEEKLSEKGLGYLSRVTNAAQRMQSLIENLLAFSRLSQTSEALSAVDLNDVVNAVREDLEVAIAEKHAVVMMRNKLPVVQGIRYQLQQLFTNLINNSLKFSRSDAAPVITLSCEQVERQKESFITSEMTPSFYRISLHDNGIGFDSKYATKIFEVFQRVPSSSGVSGTGIGLAIAKKVMENHGGFIEAKGEPNVGASFFLYFPSE